MTKAGFVLIVLYVLVQAGGSLGIAISAPVLLLASSCLRRNRDIEEPCLEKRWRLPESIGDAA